MAYAVVLHSSHLGNESPSIVAELLDVKKHPRKPQYSLASEVPLCLYEAVYDSVKWVHNRGEISKLMDQLQRTWAMLSIKYEIFLCQHLF